jgi:hypothetical protein
MTVLLSLGLFWLAYRIIRNGFVYPQSDRLGCFGVLGCIVMAGVALVIMTRLF